MALQAYIIVQFSSAYFQGSERQVNRLPYHKLKIKNKKPVWREKGDMDASCTRQVVPQDCGNDEQPRVALSTVVKPWHVSVQTDRPLSYRLEVFTAFLNELLEIVLLHEIIYLEA